MNILITGASGVIGRAISKGLATEHTLFLVDQRDPEETGDENFKKVAVQHTYTKTDISDRVALQKLLTASRLDAVVHLAAILGRQTAWEEVLRSNIVGAINVFETSLGARIERVIYASSNNIYGGYEEDASTNKTPLHEQRYPAMLREDSLPRPDSRYAAAKLMIEEYATFVSKRFGLRTFGLRIGTVRELDDPDLQSQEREMIPRFRTTWLYHQDLVQLVQLCLRTQVEYGIYNSISGRPGERGIFMDISKAMSELGYSPVQRKNNRSDP